ncbi:MAG: substrate-binding periplasmic protein, partial [Halodesulfovibrio sp.]
MRHFLLLLLILLCFTVPADAAESLTFVVPEYPPHSFADPASPHGASGLSVDIVSTALDKMGVSYTIKVYPWARSLYLVEQGLVDGVFNLYKTEERQQALDYCSEVLFAEQVCLIARAGVDTGWNG